MIFPYLPRKKVAIHKVVDLIDVFITTKLVLINRHQTLNRISGSKDKTFDFSCMSAIVSMRMYLSVRLCSADPPDLVKHPTNMLKSAMKCSVVSATKKHPLMISIDSASNSCNYYMYYFDYSFMNLQLLFAKIEYWNQSKYLDYSKGEGHKNPTQLFY